MPGAYVAKPAIVSTPDVPPGWDDDWPPPGATDPPWAGIDPDPFFPAPLPPGYVTDYSIITTATASIAPTGTASATSTIRDHDDYASNEPSAITWTATIDGETIDLKFDGGEFASSIEEDPVWGTYWGTTPDIIFDLDDDNDGDTIVLQASCIMANSEGREEELTDTSEITISTIDVYSYVLTMTWDVPPTNILNWTGSYPANFFSAWAELKAIGGSSSICYFLTYFRKTGNGGSPTYDWIETLSNSDSDHVVAGTGLGGSATITIPDLSQVQAIAGGHEIWISFDNYSGKCDCTGTAQLVVKKNDVIQSTTNLALAVSRTPYVRRDRHRPWITITNEDGSVVVDNP